MQKIAPSKSTGSTVDEIYECFIHEEFGIVTSMFTYGGDMFTWKFT